MNCKKYWNTLKVSLLNVSSSGNFIKECSFCWQILSFFNKNFHCCEYIHTFSVWKGCVILVLRISKKNTYLLNLRNDLDIIQINSLFTFLKTLFILRSSKSFFMVVLMNIFKIIFNFFFKNWFQVFFNFVFVFGLVHVFLLHIVELRFCFRLVRMHLLFLFTSSTF